MSEYWASRNTKEIDRRLRESGEQKGTDIIRIYEGEPELRQLYRNGRGYSGYLEGGNYTAIGLIAHKIFRILRPDLKLNQGESIEIKAKQMELF